jgi:hypothetical protein
MHDHFERQLVERVLIGVFLALALLVGPAIAYLTDRG